MAVINVVSWNALPGIYAWKFPSTELSTWTQLIVRESQEAVMLKDGKAVGPFGPGRHTLSSENFPFLNKILAIPFGRSPYFAEVWFVQKAFTLNVPWGTTDPLQLEDPEFHIMLPVRAFGQYGITVDDPCKFLTKLVGTLPAFTQRTLTSYFRGILVMGVKDLIAKYLVEKNVSILKISAHLNEIAEYLESKFTEKFSTYGLRFVNFTVNSISTDEADPAVRKLKAAMASRAEMQIMGYDYRTMRSFDTMEAAASNKGNGGAMGAGMGMGMGMGMGVPMGSMAGQMFAQNMSFGAAPHAPAPAAPAPAAAPTRKCPKCGQDSPATMKFCPSCGAPMESKAADTTPCPSCGKGVPKGMKFCPECGTRMSLVCPNCKKDLPPGMKFCPECGQKIN